MICPECNKEMKAGAAVFLGAAGPAPMMCNFTAGKEKDKGFFNRRVFSVMTFNGFEYKSYCCEDCKIVMPVIR